MTNRRVSRLWICSTFFLASWAHGIETFFEEDNMLPRVNFALVVRGGSVADPVGKEGLTQFLGEILLRGTKTRSREELNEAIDQLGAELGVETRHEALILRGAVLSRNLEALLAIVREMLVTPAFGEPEIKKLKEELVAALLEETGNDAHVSLRHFGHLLFGDHPYGHSPLGKIKHVQTFTRDDLTQHFAQLFTRNRLLVVGLGQAKTQTMTRWAEALSATLPETSALAELSAPPAPPRTLLQIVNKPNRTQTQIEIGQIGVPMNDPAYFALYLGNHAFGGRSFQARLMQEIRVKRGWSYGAGCALRRSRLPHWFEIWMAAGIDVASQAIALVHELYEDFASNGPTDDEVEFARSYLVGAMPFHVATARQRMQLAVRDAVFELPDGYTAKLPEEFAVLSPADVRAACARHLRPAETVTVAVTTAAGAKFPADTQVVDHDAY